MIDIPIYRAKKIDSEEYIEGCLMPCGSGSYCISVNVNNLWHAGDEFKIDISTLAIHFPEVYGMVSKDGIKLFASLRKDKKGGDICEAYVKVHDSNIKGTMYFDGTVSMGRYSLSTPLRYIKSNGIQE